MNWTTSVPSKGFFYYFYLFLMYSLLDIFLLNSISKFRSESLFKIDAQPKFYSSLSPFFCLNSLSLLMFLNLWTTNLALSSSFSITSKTISSSSLYSFLNSLDYLALSLAFYISSKLSSKESLKYYFNATNDSNSCLNSSSEDSSDIFSSPSFKY